MAPDVYLKAAGYRRQRRHARISTSWDGRGEVMLAMLPTEPFVQHTPDTPRFDGVPRHFEPCNPTLLESPAFRHLLAVDLAAVGSAGHGWEVGVHQMRVLWNGTNTAEATPEGRHSDGHLFVAIHLIGLSPSTGGISQVFESRTAPAPVFTTRLENLLAEPGSEVLADVDAHILRSEYGLAAKLWSIQTRTFASLSGRVSPEAVEPLLAQLENVTMPTRLVCIEDTHTAAGGVPQDFGAVRQLADRLAGRGVALYCDGARLWYANVVQGVPLAAYGEVYDGLTDCRRRPQRGRRR